MLTSLFFTTMIFLISLPATALFTVPRPRAFFHFLIVQVLGDEEALLHLAVYLDHDGNAVFDKNLLWDELNIRKREYYVKGKNHKIWGFFSSPLGRT